MGVLAARTYPAGWQAGWGGAMQNVSSDLGAYGPEAWRGATTYWGASASSLPIAGGLITLEDLERGEINHALAIAVPKVRAGVYASPAERTDGKSTELLSLPEGAHQAGPPAQSRSTGSSAVDADDGRSGAALWDRRQGPSRKRGFLRAGSDADWDEPVRLLARLLLRREVRRPAARLSPWSDLQLLKMNLHNAS